MSHPTAPSVRPDIDIREDILEVITHYPPLLHDRNHLEVTVVEGVVFIAGYIKSRVSRTYLMNTLPLVRGVVSVNTDQLYDDESLRLEIGGKLPSGVIASVDYGVVVLSGTLPAGSTPEQVAMPAASIPGIRRLVTTFRE